MWADITQKFLQHLHSISSSCKLKITKQVSVMFYRNFHGSTIQVIEVLYHPFHIIRHHHSREVITNHQILIMFFRRMFANPGAAKKFFKTIRFRTVVVVGQHGDEQTFPETTGTEKDGSIIVFKPRNVICLINIIKATFTHFCEVGHCVWNRYSCHNRWSFLSVKTKVLIN